MNYSIDWDGPGERDRECSSPTHRDARIKMQFQVNFFSVGDFDKQRTMISDVVAFVSKYRALLPENERDDFVSDLDKILITVRDTPKLPF